MDVTSLTHEEALRVLSKLQAVSPALSRLVSDAVSSELQAREQPLLLHATAEAHVNGGGAAVKLGKDKEWHELTTEEIESATTLGYTQQAWEDGEDTAATQTPWNQLGAHERNAAQVCPRASSIPRAFHVLAARSDILAFLRRQCLGYAQPTWDAELGEEDGATAPPSTFEDRGVPPAAPPAEPHVVPARTGFVQPLAPPAEPRASPETQEFDFGAGAAAGKDKLWPELTDAERVAASNLGYDQAMCAATLHTLGASSALLLCRARWDAGEAPDVCSVPFQQLNTTHKISAQALGYTQATWDAELPSADETAEPPLPPPQPHSWVQVTTTLFESAA